MAPPLILPKLILLILVLCLLFQHKNHNKNTNSNANTFNSINIVPIHSFSSFPVSLSAINNSHVSESSSSDSSSNFLLEYDFYRDSCPHAEHIVRSTLHLLYKTNPALVPALIRLVFHDCFIQLEEACPGVVSCADILVLAARDSVVLAGGPFYPLNPGRRDGSNSFADIATDELPSPYADLTQTRASFKSRGFDEREMVTLLGAHSIGVIPCKFFENCLYNFSGTNEPDPSLDTQFLNVLRSKCNETDALSTSASAYSSHASPSSLVEEQQEITTDSGESLSNFGTLYYRRLLQGKGILYEDQQLMEGEKTRYWVQYASNRTLFHQDFALAMMKLSDLRVLTKPMGQIRCSCSKV
ncbi:putative peroxidase [Medicago truncatula]|uniref:Peroxidase n=1 Tax=Medicago truncatula TaxID=3880 RepID=A0A396I4T7_MEDTR|nr:putative peroxidase [Medicago truncatula]